MILKKNCSAFFRKISSGTEKKLIYFDIEYRKTLFSILLNLFYEDRFYEFLLN